MIAKDDLRPVDLLPRIKRFWELSARKIQALEARWTEGGAPVFTREGKYVSQDWTDWTEGFRYGSMILHFDATGDLDFLEMGREATVREMTDHLTHTGVHDHGFNNVSTYGNLWRLAREGRYDCSDWERNFYELALKASAAVQASRWTQLNREEKSGFIYSFNGPHSLFSDTVRSLRSLALGHLLGHVLSGEGDCRVSLLERLIQHARTTSRFNVYFGRGRDIYDVRGRVAHESIFNLNDGSFRCASTQQGFSPFSTWTRGLAWIMCGFAEQLEFLETLEPDQLLQWGGKESVLELFEKTARACCHYYLQQTPLDGIPYWDTAAPGLSHLGDYLGQKAQPFNEHEPVDSSAASIAAQGFLRLGRFLSERGCDEGTLFWQSGLTILSSLLEEPYLGLDPAHEGLILHSVYHRPRGWDHVPAGRRTPCGEATMWGDYHARELVLYVERIARGGEYLRFFGPSTERKEAASRPGEGN